MTAAFQASSCSLACAIERFRQRLGLLRLLDGVVEIAGRRRLRRGQGLFGGGPLVLERARFLFGRLGRGECRLEVGLGAGGRSPRLARQQQSRAAGMRIRIVVLPHGRAPGPEIGRPLLM